MQTFSKTAGRLAEAFIERPSKKALLDFLLLPRVLGIALEAGSLGKTLEAFPRTYPAPPDLQQLNTAPRSTEPAQQASKLLKRGFISRAARALYDNKPLAPNSKETLDLLREKHPIGLKDPFLGKRPSLG